MKLDLEQIRKWAWLLANGVEELDPEPGEDGRFQWEVLPPEDEDCPDRNVRILTGECNVGELYYHGDAQEVPTDLAEAICRIGGPVMALVSRVKELEAEKRDYGMVRDIADRRLRLLEEAKALLDRATFIPPVKDLGPPVDSRKAAETMRKIDRELK